MSVSVCLSVCLSVRLSVHDHISRTTRPIFTNFVHVTCGSGSVLLGDVLRISGLWMTSYLHIS